MSPTQFIDLHLGGSEISYMSLRVLRRFYSAPARQGFGDFFGETEASKTSQTPQTPSEYNSNKDLRNHPEIYAKLNPAAKPTTELLSPLKQQLYSKVLEKHGKFVNNEHIEHEGAKYRLHLTPEEIKALEPSVYCQSYRIKSSWKKAYMFLRIFRRMPLMDAITQSHFTAKALGRDVGEMLTRGKADAEKLGMDPSRLVIEQIWVGKDGKDRRTVDIKGRGRAGISTHPNVHVKAILRDQSYFDNAELRFKKRLDKKVWNQLRNWTIKEDPVQTAEYKW